MIQSAGTVVRINTAVRIACWRCNAPRGDKRSGKREKDPIKDDQAPFLLLKGKGLVVIGGCSHAGIVNTVLSGKKLSGGRQRPCGPGRVSPGRAAFRADHREDHRRAEDDGPHVVVPMHCTGWNAIRRFPDAFPSSFVLSSVGSTYTLASATTGMTRNPPGSASKSSSTTSASAIFSTGVRKP